VAAIALEAAQLLEEGWATRPQALFLVAPAPDHARAVLDVFRVAVVQQGDHRRQVPQVAVGRVLDAPRDSGDSAPLYDFYRVAVDCVRRLDLLGIALAQAWKSFGMLR
jgi:hypothetical protein